MEETGRLLLSLDHEFGLRRDNPGPEVKVVGGRPQPQALRVEWQMLFIGALIAPRQPWRE